MRREREREKEKERGLCERNFDEQIALCGDRHHHCLPSNPLSLLSSPSLFRVLRVLSHQILCAKRMKGSEKNECACMAQGEI